MWCFNIHAFSVCDHYSSFCIYHWAKRLSWLAPLKVFNLLNINILANTAWWQLQWSRIKKIFVTMDSEMGVILNKLGLTQCVSKFLEEKISPDLVCKLSMYDMNGLGVYSSVDMMKLRTQCIKYGPLGKQTCRLDPKYNIPRQIIETLIESGFKIHEIAKLLSVSERTIFRRMTKFNLSVYQFSEIDDAGLENALAQVTTEFPRIGEAMIRQVLNQRGIKVFSLLIITFVLLVCTCTCLLDFMFVTYFWLIIS